MAKTQSAIASERFASTTGGNETILLPDQEKAYRTPQGTQYRSEPMGAVDLTPDPTEVRGALKIQALKEHPAFGVRFRSVDQLEEKIEQVQEEKQSEAPQLAGQDAGKLDAAAQLQSDEAQEIEATQAEAPQVEASQAEQEAEQQAEEATADEEDDIKTLGYTNPNQAIAYLGRETNAEEEDLKEIRGDVELIRAFAQEHGLDFPNLQ